MKPHPAEPLITHAEFLFGVADMAKVPKQRRPEVALVGRSNVGKSSLINRLAQQKIARVSGTPGATRQLNYYNLTGELSRGRSDSRFDLALVDMPGFGYAKLSKVEREQISRLVVTYLREREQARAVVLLNDCRRLPEEEERITQRLCAEEGLACIVVITKMDALKRSEQVRSIAGIAQAYNLEPGDILTTGTDTPTRALWERIVAVTL